MAFHAPCAFPHYSITLLMIVMKSMQTKPMPLFHEEKIYSQLNCVPPQFTQGADQLYDCQNYPFVRPPPLELHWKCWKCRCNNGEILHSGTYYTSSLYSLAGFKFTSSFLALDLPGCLISSASEWRSVEIECLHHHCVLYWLVSVIKLASDQSSALPSTDTHGQH